MDISFSIPGKIKLGEGCVAKNAEMLAALGKRAFIAAANSTKKNGALRDIEEALLQQGIAFEEDFSTVPNPPVSDCLQMGKRAREFGADFIIAIGGGSVMDAAKAAAAFAVNDMTESELFLCEFEKRPLPIVAVPTTCGTGSEVTKVSVLTVGESKKSFTHEAVYPVLALIDPNYLITLPAQIAADTAVDALSHALEGFLMEDDPVSDMFAREEFKCFGEYKKALLTGALTERYRELLMYGALMAGLTIDITRTSAVHAMGYQLTVFKGYSHGRACGVLLGRYAKLCESVKKEKVYEFLRLAGFESSDEFIAALEKLLGENERFSEAEIEKYALNCEKAACGKNNPVKFTGETVRTLYKESLF